MFRRYGDRDRERDLDLMGRVESLGLFPSDLDIKTAFLPVFERRAINSMPSSSVGFPSSPSGDPVLLLSDSGTTCP